MLTKNTFRSALFGCAAVAILGACSGADGVASPGVGAFVPAPAPVTPPPTTPPPPTGPAPGTPAADCPAGFANVGIVSNRRVCQLPSTITGNLVVPARAGTIYSVANATQVGTDRGPISDSPTPGSVAGILTIEPGVTIFGSTGLDYLLVNRGSQIFAEGTPTNPIIMTSRQNVEGTAGADSIGQWGGLVILGRAPTQDGCGTLLPPNQGCEAAVEGSNAFYGGNSPADNSGRVRYLRLSFSGFAISENNELNGITLAGVGSGTTFNHVQVHNSSDDGIEIFGGNVNIKNIVLTGNDDDSLDTDSGWRGAAQFGIVAQRANGGDFGFETSSRGTNTATFFTRPTYANWTVVMRANSTRDAIVHNTGHVPRFYNSVIRHPGSHQCVNVAQNVTLSNPNGVSGNGPLYRGVLLSCAGGNGDGGDTIVRQTGDPVPPQIPDADINTLLTDASNVLSGTSTLTGTFINGANETAVAAVAFPTTLNAGAGLNPSNTNITGFLTATTYIGAVRDANDTWYAGWTCSLPGQTAC
jgi:hypothetical protein